MRLSISRRILLSVFAFVCSGTVAHAQNFWQPVKQIKGVDDLPMSSNPAVLEGDTAIYALNADGIFRSIDKGGSWTIVSTELRDGGIGIKRLIKAQNGIWVASLLGLDGTIYSTDGGIAWQASAGLPFLLVQHIVVHPEGALFASVRDKGVMRSVDHGKNWNEMNTGLPEGFWGEGLIALKNGDLLVGMGFGNNHGLYRSTNKGVSWSEVTSLQTPLIQTFAQDQLGRVYAGTTDRGVFMSTDNGMTWTASDTTGVGLPSVESIAIGNDTTVFISTEGGGIFRSRDGHTWTLTGAGSGGSINQIAVGMDGYVYAGIPQGMVRSLESTGNLIPNTGQGGVKSSTEANHQLILNVNEQTLRITGLESIGRYRLVDILGRVIEQAVTSSNVLSISTLPSGTYMLIIGERSFVFNKQ
jgi:photosystem II stability/assembly factor-like uncharacterized protein